VGHDTLHLRVLEQLGAHGGDLVDQQVGPRAVLYDVLVETSIPRDDHRPTVVVDAIAVRRLDQIPVIHFERRHPDAVLLVDHPSHRELFGDETTDYGAALGSYYREGPKPDWNRHYVTAYASSHPHEDWAETFAHYIHIVDTLDSARAYGIGLRSETDQNAAVAVDVRDRFRRSRSTQCDVHKIPGRLRQRLKRLKARVRFAQVRGESHIVYHADDFLPVSVGGIRAADAFANRAFVRPEASRRRFIDDGDRGAVGGVSRSECAT